MGLMGLFYAVDVIEARLFDYIVTLPAYWATRILIGLLQALLFPLGCVLFARRIHDIGFNGWAGILWASIIIFINTYIAVSPFKLFIRPICMDYWIPIWVLPGQPEPNKYGYPPFMHQEPLHSQEHFEPQPPTPAEQEVRKKVRKRRKKR